jgi:DNA processing protein
MIGTTNTSLASTDLIDWLRLIRTENVGPVTFRQLLAHYGSAAKAIEVLPDLAKRGGRKRPVRIASKAQAERELSAAQSLGVRLVHIGSPEYPEPLAAIDDAPPLLFVRGHPALLTRPTVAIVGTRNASANGLRMARDLARGLSEQGHTVVSGMAKGIDTAAHEGALDGGTVAVLAGGVDVVYPQQNQALYEEIVARGAAIAESPLGTEPQPRLFPKRNRLVTGMSRGVIVVEAAKQSGSLISARLAGEQGREVMAVPGHPKDPRAAGCNSLLRQGAALIEGADDALNALAGARPPGSAEHEAHGYDPAFAPAGPAAPSYDEATLAQVRQEVLNLLASTPVAVDELIRECQLSASIVTVVLLELELAGRCERHPGNRVSLIAEDVA